MSDNLAARLLQWQAAHGRKDLPWQQNPTPYRVWVSEIMLQQTQVTTVLPFYLRFMEAFPDLKSLANAPVDDVLRLWSGLGYYARARNLYKAACEIRDRYRGEFPGRFEDVVALPGIGRSTAGAILALSRGQHHAILDGNAKRVLARYHAVAGWPGDSSVASKLWELAETHTPKRSTAAYTQAIMDLGATLCTRSNPNCFRCPVCSDCRAFERGRVAEFPGRRPKKDKPLRKTHMALACYRGELYLERRPPSGIWGGLWSLPEFNLEDQLLEWCERRLKTLPAKVEHWANVRHSFSHYHLDIRPVVLHLETAPAGIADAADCIWYNYIEAPRFGVAAPVMKLIDYLKSGR
ncbi:MAG: A/G-specific adenine glycosylase [Woeseia sp.]